jgi:anti-sigma factor RsiW
MMSGSPSIQAEEALRLRHGPEADQARLRALAETDAGLAALMADWDRQDAAMRALYAPVAEEPLPERLRAQIAAARRGAPRKPPDRPCRCAALPQRWRWSRWGSAPAGAARG